MFKFLGNYVGLLEDFLSMYFKLEKIFDDQVENYFELLINLNINDIDKNFCER